MSRVSRPALVFVALVMAAIGTLGGYAAGAWHEPRPAPPRVIVLHVPALPVCSNPAAYQVG